MSNLKKQTFSIFYANWPKKGSFQPLSRHFDYRIFGARGILTLRETLSRGDAGGGPERSEWMSVANKRVQGDQYCYSSVCNAHAAIIKPRCHPEFSSASCRMASESGRSMVEMLGVLAVIGVLSIGGIAGYRAAMDTYETNEIINAVNQAAVLIAGNISGSKELEKNQTYSTDINPSGHTLTATAQGNYFEIKINGITNTICQKLIRTDWNPVIRINEEKITTATDCPNTETFDISFAFANDLGQIPPADKVIFDPSVYVECDASNPCADGVCVYSRCIKPENYCDALSFEANHADCPSERPLCLNQHCVSDMCQTDSDCTELDAQYCQTFKPEAGEGMPTYTACVECTQNSHCGTGYFCGGSSGSNYVSTVNTCYKTVAFGPETVNGAKYYISKEFMPWYDGHNFCASIGNGVTMLENDDIIPIHAELYEKFSPNFSNLNGVWSLTDYFVDWNENVNVSDPYNPLSKKPIGYAVQLPTGNIVSRWRGDYLRVLCRQN